MAVVKGMNIRMILVILTCYTCFVGNPPVSYGGIYQSHTSISSSKRSCTFTLRCPRDDWKGFDDWLTAGSMISDLICHEYATVRTSSSRPTIPSTVCFLCKRRHCVIVSRGGLGINRAKAVTWVSRLKLHDRMERVVSSTILLTCTADARCCPYGWKCPWFVDSCLVYFDINITVAELCFDSSFSFLGQGACTLRNNTIQNTTLSNSSANFFIPLPQGKDFPHFPGGFRSFLYNRIFSHHLGGQGHGNAIATVLYFFCSIIFRFTISLTVFLSLYEKDDNTNNNESTIILRFLRFKCVVKRHWCRGQWNHRVSDSSELISTKSLYNQNSVMNVLNEYIFRPWQSKSRAEDTESCWDCFGSSDCHCMNKSVFSECHDHIDSFHNPDFMTIHVNPVTRFLPDPTFNPDLDLSHVAYRLATLGALPPSVSVSRVRLADAGFYFRGHDVGVTCYSCHVCHSDWSRGDDPMDIHRELSPHCEHVLARDHELAVQASGNNQGMTVNGVCDDGHQRSVLNSTPEDSHVQDGESSETQTRASRAAPNQMASLPLNPAASTTNASEEHSASMATSVPTNRIPQEQSSHTLQNSVLPSSSRIENTNVQSSIMNLTNMGTSTTRISSTDNSTVITDTTRDSRITGAESFSHIQPESAANSGSSVNRNSASGSSQHLYPQARLDLSQVVYPMYQDMASRRRSFTIAWDERRAPPLDEVILSGMFYAGYADCVRCFCCGVGLKSWAVTDNVWTEHVRWRPACAYLRTVKGDDFIRTTQRQLGISSPTDGHHAAQHSSQAQGIQNEPSQPVTTSPTISTQVLTAPARVPVSFSGPNTCANATATATTSSSAAASSRISVVPRTGQRGSVATTAITQSSSAGRVERIEGGRGGEERPSSTVAEAADGSGERERLARLQEENRRLSQQLQCRLCHLAAVDTILMPCGHLVVCSTCAASVTSCPLCHHSILATALVFMEN